jgi:hypothetical protein
LAIVDSIANIKKKQIRLNWFKTLIHFER